MRNKLTMKHKKNTYSDYQKYLHNELSDKDRYVFEKNSQNNSFELEALEGIDQLKSSNFIKDTDSLNKLISKKQPKKGILKTLRRYNAVASLLLIVGMASYFYFTQQNKTHEDEIFNPQHTPSIPIVIDAPVPNNIEHEKEEIVFESNEENSKKIRVTTQHNQKLQRKKAPIKLNQIDEIQISEAPTTILEESKNVEGTILDNEGNPLPGVMISIDGKEQVATSDFDGKFNINIDSTENLTFDYLGFEQAIRPANDSMLIVLQESDESLDEVVVVGYGTVKKKEVTGSITSIKSKDLEKNIHPDLEKALSGNVAGVSIHKDSIGSILSLPPQGDLEDFTDWIIDSFDETLVSDDETIWIYLEFKIQENGKISNIKFRNKVRRKIRKEITRILKTSENWEPSTFDNLPIDEKILIKFEIY